MSDIHFFGELKPSQKRDAAYFVSSLCNEDNAMKPVSYDEVLATEIALVAFAGGEYDEFIAGYIRSGEPLVDKSRQISKPKYEYVEIGSLVVASHFRGVGIATELLRKMTGHTIGSFYIPYAFCTQRGMRSFAKVGYQPALPGELPIEAISQFGNQPMVYYA